MFSRLFAAPDEAGQTLLRALAPSLQLPPEWFAERVAAGNSVLRVIHYPPVAADAAPGAARSAAHQDINLLTLLVAARGGDLQLLDRDGSADTGIANTTRYSIPFFVHPTNATSLAALPSRVTPDRPPRNLPVTAGDYLEERLREIGLRS